ncbi:MAG: glycosyltransferase family 9 protein [Pseudomonadota bacterium]|jgi:heptosyltransferase-3
MNAPASVLVVVTRRIGDVLLATPLIRSLRRAWPQAQIDVLVFAGTEGILAANPDVNRVITVAQRPSVGEHMRFLLGLWRSYDLAVSAVPSDRPTLYACVAGKRRVGLVAAGAKHAWKKFVLSRSAAFDEATTHAVLTYLKLANLLGVARDHEVVAAWTEEDASVVRKLLPFDWQTQPYAVLHAYPMYAYKMWRREAWAELARWIEARGLRVVLSGGGGADELAYIAELQRTLPGGAVNLAGCLSLGGVACLLSRARAYVGPDTVVTHIAAAVGVPTVALFGPSSPVKWGPWPKGYIEDRTPYRMLGTQRTRNVVLLQGEGECVPCLQEGCERHTASLSACLQNLPAARVIAVLQEILENQVAHERTNLS